MDSIRVSKSTVIVEVNDAGETIEINLRDQALVKEIQDLTAQIEAVRPKYERLLAEIGKKDPSDIHRLDDILEYNREVCTELRDRTDAVFGDGACRKVFGAGIPSIEGFVELYSSLVPIINKRNAESASRLSAYMSRYSTAKGGAQ